MSAPPPSGGVEVVRHQQRRARRPLADVALQRPRDGRRLGGVALGIATFVRADTRLVRALWLVSAPLTLGVSVVTYAILWLLLPAEAAA